MCKKNFVHVFASLAGELPGPGPSEGMVEEVPLKDGHSGRASPSPAPAKKINAVGLVGLTFFAVCGGDYGIEDAVGAAGPAYTLRALPAVSHDPSLLRDLSCS